MNLQIISGEEKDRAGREMYQLMVELFPLCRSLTGDGLRETHSIIKKHLPIETHEIPTGTKVFDWTVPKEWNIRDAYVISPHGEKIIDFQKSNLHVVNYSIPVNARLPLAELRPHLHTLPDQPDLIPYLTSYYEEKWGFCLSHNQFIKLPDEEYEVFIDSSLEDGHLTYGEFYIEGEVSDEVLISCYTCHPSLCNDNLSGVVLTTFLAKYLSQFSLKYSYRFLFVPETIGSITWLCMNKEKVSKIKHGLVITCAGDPGCLTYKKSRQGNAEIDKAAINVLRTSGSEYEILDFFPWGSDERQFCSPGFNLPVGSLMRTPYGKFPEYHTSADNLDFVRPEYLADSFSKYVSVLYILGNNSTYINLNPKCEPQLGRRGLYKKNGQKGMPNIYSMFWVLNLSDGSYSLLDIADRSNFDFVLIKKTADILCENGLLKKA
jgi:aminopeptidase-like protein